MFDLSTSFSQLCVAIYGEKKMQNFEKKEKHTIKDILSILEKKNQKINFVKRSHGLGG